MKKLLILSSLVLCCFSTYASDFTFKNFEINLSSKSCTASQLIWINNKSVNSTTISISCGGRMIVKQTFDSSTIPENEDIMGQVIERMAQQDFFGNCSISNSLDIEKPLAGEKTSAILSTVYCVFYEKN